MEELVRILTNIKIETKELSAPQIQVVLANAKRHQITLQLQFEYWNNVLETLIKHLETGLNKIDDQLLCATCFFSVITLSDKQEYYLQKLKDMIDVEISLRSQGIKEDLNTFQIVSMIYGLFQSSFLITNNIDKARTLNLLHSSTKLLIIMGYEYSQYTYTVFKTLSSYKKIIGTEFEESILSVENQISLLNLVNHNWENPITGVRDLNRIIFQLIIANTNTNMLQRIIHEINLFYWSKAKFLMLTVVIENFNGDIKKLMYDNNWDIGLIDNLHKPGLISALTDMYFAVLGKIKTLGQWHQIFLPDIIKILNGSCSRAIENFNNYWLLITLKKFPSLLDVLLESLLKSDESEQRLHSILFLIKQGKKIGIPSNIMYHSTVDNMMFIGIEHSNTQIRMLAFDILCFSSYKTMPSQFQYEMVLKYVKYNINSDCTVLRISMLKSFDTFMGELHISFRSLKDKLERNVLVDFCSNIQELIVDSLNFNGNYQRKFTTIKVCNLFIHSVNEIPKKRRQQTKESNVTLIDFLKAKNSWILLEETFVMKLVSLLKDPSDDIREGVKKLLLSHYHTELRKSQSENGYFSNIIEEALKCMKSKFFYDVSCGQTMFNLIVNILLKDNCVDAMFKSVEDVFNFGYNELKTEYALKRSITTTIEEGKQLHSFICILQVVLEASLSTKNIKIPDKTMNDLLEMIEDISNQFSWEQSQSTLSDFSEMSDMVENIIEQSGHKTVENDGTKISGLHQMVLNCLWYNVKTSCQLASLLIQYNTDDVERCAKCLVIITRVLETSRHKGVIEAAGVALGKAIQYLTSLPEHSAASSLPQTLLISKLQMMITEASKMASITRRGAGLSIMVHRIVAGDMRKGKPLFHYFMKTILKTCQDTADLPNAQEETNMENQMDLPKAILIHFLTKIVTDSSLASDMMFYSAELAEVAFSNLKSPHWQIRNAALQLYGALVQKLVGQKKASGKDDEIIATVACDELRTHSPKLWSYIMEQLKNNSQGDKIETHSNLIPILNMLANCAKRYNFSYDLKSQIPSDTELLDSLATILDSPIHTVRRLTAKCIFNMFTCDDIIVTLEDMDFDSENLLHGALLLFKFCYQYYVFQYDFLRHVLYLEDMFKTILETEDHSYWCKEVFESTVCYHQVLDTVLLEAKNNSNALGIPLWMKTSIRNCIKRGHWISIPDYLKILLEYDDHESYCEFFVEKLSGTRVRDIPTVVLEHIADVLLTYENKYNSSVIWKILYLISLRIDVTILDTVKLFESLSSLFGDSNNVTYTLRYIVPFASRICKIMTDKQQKHLLNLIFELSNSETADYDMRYIAVLANNEIANHFDKLSDEVKMTSIKSAIFLLQDEDEDVRSACINYYKNIKKSDITFHSNICLHKILNRDFLSEIFDNPKTIEILCAEIKNFASTNLHRIDEDNPFANDSKNIYLEINVLYRLVEKVESQ